MREYHAQIHLQPKILLLFKLQVGHQKTAMLVYLQKPLISGTASAQLFKSMKIEYMRYLHDLNLLHDSMHNTEFGVPM